MAKKRHQYTGFNPWVRISNEFKEFFNGKIEVMEEDVAKKLKPIRRFKPKPTKTGLRNSKFKIK